jgi:hypothetical protein
LFLWKAQKFILCNSRTVHSITKEDINNYGLLATSNIDHPGCSLAEDLGFNNRHQVEVEGKVALVLNKLSTMP